MTPVVHAVGWALLHFLWQGGLVAAIFAVASRLLRTAEARYALGVGAMIAMLALPVLTGVRYARSGEIAAAAAEGTPARVGTGVTTLASDSRDASAGRAPVARRSETLASRSAVDAGATLADALAPIGRQLPVLVACWLAGVLLLSLRLFDAWLHAHRLTRHETRPAAESHQVMLRRVAARLNIRRAVGLLESTRLAVPAVVGWLRPVVLLPAVALTGLTPQQVEALIAHELAHVMRHDFLANILQSAIETLFFYHPAVWYVSRRVRAEREHCCDDVAMRLCGNPEEYARALLGLAERRAGVPALVAAATGGPLLTRVRRLLTPGSAPADTFPRWIVGSAVLVAAALLAGAGRALEANDAVVPPVAGIDDRPGLEDMGPAAIRAFAADTDKVGADTVLHAPPGPLASRWQWARDEAGRRGFRAYWVGYTIEPLATKENRSIYIGRLERQGLEGSGVSLRGRIVSFGDFEGFRVPGVRLAPLVGGGMPDDVAVLFLYVVGNGGRPVLARVHASSLALPVDLEGRAVMWLGQGSDAESVPLVRRLHDQAPTAELREDVVSLVGVHSTSSLVVPVLVDWVEGRGTDAVRIQAVEWLGRHPVPQSLEVLARAARGDRVSDVRREAAESVAELELGPATDTLVALARSLDDADARREAVEGLGERGDDRSVDALAAIVRSDRDPDIQREGVESLGESGSPRSFPLLLEIARTHPSVDVRREAVETIGENLPAAEAVPVLAEIARTDRSVDVQREAIETLGETKNAQALSIVEDLAVSHPSTDARREAVETMGEASQSGATLATLARLARDESNADVASEAIETIAETQHADAPRIIGELARTHPNPAVRRDATETLSEVGDRGEAIRLLAQIATGDADADVRREAVETLGEIPEASERFIALARELLDSSPPEEVWHEVLETLEELKDGSGIAVLVTIARSHENLEIRKHAFEALAESDDPRAKKLFEDALGR